MRRNPARTDIPFGVKSALSRRDLARLWGCSDREARRQIAEFRAAPGEDGSVISPRLPRRQAIGGAVIPPKFDGSSAKRKPVREALSRPSKPPDMPCGGWKRRGKQMCWRM